MANGIRDAFGLSWRLSAILHRDQKLPPAQTKRQLELLLHSWARERRSGVDDASRRTEANGSMMLSKSGFSAFVLRIANYILNYAPSWRDGMVKSQGSDTLGFAGVEGGFFLDGAKGLGEDEEGASGGGGKLAQVYVKTPSRGPSPVLSDRLFWNDRASLTLLLLREISRQELLELRQMIETLKLPIGLLNEDIVELSEMDTTTSSEIEYAERRTTLIHPSREADLKGPVLLAHYNPDAFRKRFKPGVLCALVRPDFIAFSQAQTPVELRKQLGKAAAALTGTIHMNST